MPYSRVPTTFVFFLWQRQPWDYFFQQARELAPLTFDILYIPSSTQFCRGLEINRGRIHFTIQLGLDDHFESDNWGFFGREVGFRGDKCEKVRVLVPRINDEVDFLTI